MYLDRSLLGLFWLFALFHVGCSPVDSSSQETKDAGGAQIVCTTGMIADVARAVAGQQFVVNALLGTGVDPHLYKPTRSDVVQLSGADIVFYNGLHLEGKMGEILDGLSGKGRTVLPVAEVALQRSPDLVVIDRADSTGQADPHLWMDVEGWMTVVDVIPELLSAYDPEHATEYQANAAVYREELARLDVYVSASLATIPERQRILVTAHDAFGYLGNAYGIEVRGIQGLSTESEAGLRDLEDLVDCIVERSVPAVFVESSVADKNVRALVEGASARGRTGRIGGELFSDAMGTPGAYEGTYIGMLDHNATTITNALGGQASGFRKL